MKFILLITTIFFTQFANAADGSSGCGPGWYLFKDNSLVSSSLRATTNVVLFPVVTIGMTLGTSNCTKHGIVQREKESLHYATHNYFELQSGIAQGSGEYLSAYSRTIGCPAHATPRLNQQLKANYLKLFPSPNLDPEKLLLETYKVIFSDNQLFQQCALAVG
jgi:hypothetical protein